MMSKVEDLMRNTRFFTDVVVSLAVWGNLIKTCPGYVSLKNGNIVGTVICC